MPSIYDGSLLDHLAQHMIFLSTAPSFWYSLNSSYDHGFHLSHRLGMTPHDYERLLAAANLAHYHRNGGSAVAAARRLWQWHQHDRAMSAAAWRRRGGGSVVAAARGLGRWRQHNSATSSAAWRRHGGIDSVSGGGGSAPVRRRRQHGGGTASAAVAAARSAAAVYSATAAARLQQRGCFGGGGSTTARRHNLRCDK